MLFPKALFISLLLYSVSRSIHFLMLLCLVSTEAIGEGYAEGAVVVYLVDDVLSLVCVVRIVVGGLEDVVAVCFHL